MNFGARPIFALLLLVVVTTAPVRGGSGQVTTTPPATVRNTSGLRLSVDTQWIEASGYRDVRLLLATTGAPSPTDRELTIELSPNAYGTADFTVRQTITLPQGATQTTAHMLVPQGQPWHQVQVQVFENGRVWAELSSETSLSRPDDDWSEAVPAFLIIDPQAPTPLDRSTLLTRYSLNQSQVPATTKLIDIRGVEMLVKRGMFEPATDGTHPNDAELLRRVASSARLDLLPPKSLPEVWLGLTAFDVVVVAQPTLQAMAKQNKTQLEALINWLRAGGNLVVYDVGEKYARLPELEKLLEISPATVDGDFAAAGWKAARSQDFNNDTTRSFQEMQSYRNYYPREVGPDGNPIEPQFNIPPIETAFGPGTGVKFVARDAGMGFVVAMSTSNPFPGSTTEWNWLLNTIESHRYMWFLRQGLSLRRENTDYWDLLVPNTGMAPVWEFCVLITLFAVIIGPINYFVLFRQKRLYLLLATIPLGAALVTFGLFFYAVVSDGLDTRVRIRSYTQIDQPAGRAASWSRQSYYAGLAPSRGLAFPSDAAVYVSEQHPKQEYDGGFQRQRLLEWGEAQNLRSGYMASRVTSQFLVQHSAETAAALRLAKRTAPSEAQNGLGCEIEQLLLRDDAGDFYWAENVPVSGQFKLEPAKLEDCRDKLKQQFLAHRPLAPPGLDANQFNNWYGGGRWYGGWGLDSGQPAPRMASNLMELRMRRLQNINKDTLAPGSYVAIGRSSPEVPLGIAGAREAGSFHVIEGKF